MGPDRDRTRDWSNSEKLLDIIALMKCEDHHTKKANIGFAL